jgi:hypothetical protein
MVLTLPPPLENTGTEPASTAAGWLMFIVLLVLLLLPLVKDEIPNSFAECCTSSHMLAEVSTGIQETEYNSIYQLHCTTNNEITFTLTHFVAKVVKLPPSGSKH